MGCEPGREIHAVVDFYCREPVLRDSLVRALQRPGFPLHPDAPCRSGTLTLGAYYSIRGEVSSAAYWLAAAVEIQMAASYMLDHVADGEVDPAHGLSPGEELTLGMSLLRCAAGAAGDVLAETTWSCGGDAPLQVFHRSYLDACAGQLLDLRLEHATTPTTDFALEMTVLKSGSLGRLAAAAGATLAEIDARGLQTYGDLGSNLFTYAQLVDDVRDACDSPGQPSDLDRGKKTVPLVFFYNCFKASDPELAASVTKDLGLDGEVREQFELSGARAFCAIVAMAFLGRARDGLAELRREHRNVDRLEDLVDSLEVTAEPVLAPS